MNAEQRSLFATQIRNDLIELLSIDPESCLRYLAKRKQRDNKIFETQQSNSQKLFRKTCKIDNSSSGVQNT